MSVLRKWRAKREKRAQIGGAREDPGHVFPDPLGCPVRPDTLNQRGGRAIADKAGLPQLRVHDLRHVHATLMPRKGVPAEGANGLGTPSPHSPWPKTATSCLTSIGPGPSTYRNFSQELPGQGHSPFPGCSTKHPPATLPGGKILRFEAGGPCRIRTCDLPIKSRLLCQLS